MVTVRWERGETYPQQWVYFSRCLFQSNEFSGSAALAEVCSLLSAILFVKFKQCFHKF